MQVKDLKLKTIEDFRTEKGIDTEAFNRYLKEVAEPEKAKYNL